MSDAQTIVRLVAKNPDRPPPLTDQELLAIRRMLADFQAVCRECPMAKHVATERSGN